MAEKQSIDLIDKDAQAPVENAGGCCGGSCGCGQ
jgi:hypothetical protein